MSGNRIFCFEIRSNGVVASTPWRIIDGFNSPIVELVNPFDIAVTPAGEIWVANLGSTPGSSSDASITIYDPNAVGAIAPTFKILPIADAFGPPIAKPVALVWRNAPANILILDATRTEVTEYTKSQQSTASVFGLGTPGADCFSHFVHLRPDARRKRHPVAQCAAKRIRSKRFCRHHGAPDRLE